MKIEKSDDSSCDLGCLSCVTSLIGIVAFIWILTHWGQFIDGVYYWMNYIFRGGR
jgi:hypothetical protein